MEELLKELAERIIELKERNKNLEYENYAISNFLREKGIDLVIERYKVSDLNDKKDEDRK